MTRRFGLSKSKITVFEQCPKRLWLATHRPELAEPDEGAEARFAVGHEVGALACSLHPDGVMVSLDDGVPAAVAATRELLGRSPPPTIFEASFEHDGVFVRVDVMEPDEDGSWRMAEVKSTGSVKDYHRGDLATQVWVARRAGVPISQASIRHIDTSFVLERDGDYAGLFRDSEIMAGLEGVILGREALVGAARGVLGGDEPAIGPGAHCEDPFPCEFRIHCHAGLPAGPEWPVTVLPNGGGKRWLEAGVADLIQVDPSHLTNPVHQKVHRATLTGEPFHDVAAARAAIGAWAYPRAWLDFETIGFAIPRWVGTRPFQQVPFQFSVHIEAEDGSLEHREFLSLDGTDPRRTCAEALLQMLPGEGAVVAYNASFERSRIMELALAFPDLGAGLEAIAGRLVDLLPVTRNVWYHRDQRGSWSIKAVLPTIPGGLGYEELEVGDGVQAQQAYIEAIDPVTTDARRAEIDAALRAYCRLDTQAMLALADHLVGGAGRAPAL